MPLELLKGKVVAVVDHTDAVRAKEILAVIPASSPLYRHPLSTLSARGCEIAKRQIKACRKGGGYMLNLSFPAQASIKDLKGLMTELKEYGRY
jgi:hypothetical protein